MNRVGCGRGFGKPLPTSITVSVAAALYQHGTTGNRVATKRRSKYILASISGSEHKEFLVLAVRKSFHETVVAGVLASVKGNTEKFVFLLCVQMFTGHFRAYYFARRLGIDNSGVFVVINPQQRTVVVDRIQLHYQDGFCHL
jgi:hypothetical protein